MNKVTDTFVLKNGVEMLKSLLIKMVLAVTKQQLLPNKEQEQNMQLAMQMFYMN